MSDKVEMKILIYGQVSKFAHSIRDRKKTIVMVSGCFDLPHLGHVEFFSDVKALADVLVVALGPDEIIKKLKGPNRPIMPQDYRAKMLASLAVVDYVVIADEPLVMPGALHFERLISLLRPDIFAINSFNGGLAEKKSLIEKYGGKLAVIEGKPVTSTTEIIGKIEKFF